MKLQEIIASLSLNPLTEVQDGEVGGVFISDMLSDVMGGARMGDLWLTVQTHKNIVSAANLVDVAAVVITHDKTVPQETVDLANRFHVNILKTSSSTYELAGKLIQIGLLPK